MNQDIKLSIIYEMWCDDFTNEQIADFLFEDESNYNNSDKTSNQPIESYEEILASVKDCIANNRSEWSREEPKEFYNSDEWEEDDRLTHIRRDD